MLELLEKQRQAEVTHNWTQSRMPGANLILNHLRVRDLPEELATLHKPVHPHTDWEPFHDILAQIISLNVEDPAVKQILALHATPLHLEVLPNSEFYHDHVEAPHTLYYAATRQLIELVMEDLIEAAKLGGLYHSSPVVAYLSATQATFIEKITALLAFTERQPINQANLSCQFLSGTFTKVRYQDIFDHNFEVEFPSHPSVSSRPSTPWGARSEDFHPDN
ncbi:hypothetical protein B0H19DRAFT_1272595 [Mycena capillaripes]|nr:hypothetical protein B0H19DRAFT_1272414 [Mycena capillaripes]KAJ6533203.1 hypothetical protein B0H19DRAFT_1272595 [Mycena capillaripes]